MTKSSPKKRMATSCEALLEVVGLSVRWHSIGGVVQAVQEVSFTISRGRALALVGRSGSGKSSVASAILGLIPASRGRVQTRSMTFEGRDIPIGNPAQMRRIRGNRIGYIGQSPQNGFDPLWPVKSQIYEAVRAHHPYGDLDSAMAIAGLDPTAFSAKYPHQWSGGLLQRAQIVAATVHGPSLLIADEPTSALDTVLALQFAERLIERKAGGMGLLVITHDLGLALRVADDIAVMDQGRIIEFGPTLEVLQSPKDPRTAALVSAHPSRGMVVAEVEA